MMVGCSGSDFSLTGHDTDLEIDYYDYNVYNTNAVPGSYLGMDPAYCVWIPPFAPGQWVDNGVEDGGIRDNDGDNDDEFSIKRKSTQMGGQRRRTLVHNVEKGEVSQSQHSVTPTGEKFQKECDGREKEYVKRYSGLSATSRSSNRTIVADEDDSTIRETSLPDSAIHAQKAFVHKDVATNESATIKIAALIFEKDDFKYADDEDSDMAYNSSDENGRGNHR